tara:strand:- start:52 stop:702 length:651 start_codon:yes stop_codon:yes gene_type:complete
MAINCIRRAVACICVGDKYTIKDIQRLEKMVFKNTTYNINFRVFDEPILPKWWTKVLYHSPIIEQFTEDVVLAFDLDVVIKGNIDSLFDWVEKQDYLCAPWARWREHMDNFEDQRNRNILCTPYNSSILGWKPNTSLKIWEEFEFEDIEKYGGFDTYLWMKKLDPIRIPDQFYYSAHFSNYEELDYPIVLFNKGQSTGISEKKDISMRVPWVNKYR